MITIEYKDKLIEIPNEAWLTFEEELHEKNIDSDFLGDATDIIIGDTIINEIKKLKANYDFSPVTKKVLDTILTITESNTSDLEKSEIDELDEWNSDELIKSFVGDALQAIKMGALYRFYKDVSESDIPIIHAIIKNAFLEKRLSLREMIKQIVSQTGLDEEKARMIARTESSSVAMKAREIGWKKMEEERGEKFLYKNVTKFDHRTSWVSKRIDTKVRAEGGAVTLDRLREIYKEESTKPYIAGNPNESGMGADWDGWRNFVGHVNERCTVVRSPVQ